MASLEARLHTVTAKLELITEECPGCGIVFAWPKQFHDNVSRSGGALRGYCPNGHVISWNKSEADKLREQLDAERRQRQRAEQNVAMWADDAREAREAAKRERSRANGYKGHATRITKRAKAGVCPCCNRTFKQLAAHMATQHPQFTPIEIHEGEPATIQ